MMPYKIIVKVRKFHQPTANRFCTARQKPVGGGTLCSPPPSLNRVKEELELKISFTLLCELIAPFFYLSAEYISDILVVLKNNY